MKGIMFVTALLVNVLGASAEVVTYPVPKEEKLSNDYELWVNDKKVDIYTARTVDPPFAGQEWDYGGPYSFANFDMSGTVEVRIKSKRSLKNVITHPESKRIKPILIDDNTMTIILDRPEKLSIEPDGIKGPLLLFANPIETDVPDRNDPNVVFFEPGLHKPERIDLTDDQTLYLSGGAVVKAEVFVKGKNVRICGRGILDGSDWEWRTGSVGSLILLKDCYNVEIRDITMRGSSHWTIETNDCQKLVIQNVKICNSRVQNDDGIDPCNSRNILIKDCFIRSDDDCIALKGLDPGSEDNNVEMITIENSTFWCDRARIFLLGHESQVKYMRNIIIKNVDIIHFSMTPFLFEPGEEMTIENVIVEDIRIHGDGQDEFIRLRPVVNQYMVKKVPGYIRNVVFRDVKIEGKQGKYLIQIDGPDVKHNVQNVVLQNVFINGSLVTKTSKNVRIGENADNIWFTKSSR